jgi:hypothetical protein
MGVDFHPPWDRVTSAEAWYWLGACFLLLPGVVSLGLATASTWARVLAGLVSKLEPMSARDRTLAVLLVGVIATALARVLNALLFQGLPFTDDEYAAMFGGQVWAEGHLAAPLPPWISAAPQLFLFSRAGTLASFDFPGVVGAWALSAVTHTGTLVFSLLAGASTVGLVVAAARRWGMRSGALAAVLALASPHFLLLSASSHGQLVSRGLLAASFAALLFVQAPGTRRGLAGGVLLGMAFLARPIEVAFVAGPWALGMVVDAARGRRTGFIAGFLSGALAMVLVFLALNWGTGHSLLPTRLAPNEIVHPYINHYRPNFDLRAWVDRFGNNVMYNLVSTGVFLFGPLGLVIAALGANLDGTHRRLTLGVLAAFGLGLLHDDYGIHALGPVHVSEASLALLILVVGGLRRLAGWATDLGLRTSFLGGLAGYALGLGVFTGGYALSIGRQASTQTALYGLVDDAAESPAVLLAPTYASLYAAADKLKVGSWIFSWRRVTPSATEKVIVLHDSAKARARVAQWFPDRLLLVLNQTPSGPHVTSLSEAAPPPAVRGMWVELQPISR